MLVKMLEGDKNVGRRQKMLVKMLAGDKHLGGNVGYRQKMLVKMLEGDKKCWRKDKKYWKDTRNVGKMLEDDKICRRKDKKRWKEIRNVAEKTKMLRNGGENKNISKKKKIMFSFVFMKQNWRKRKRCYEGDKKM